LWRALGRFIVLALVLSTLHYLHFSVNIVSLEMTMLVVHLFSCFQVDASMNSWSNDHGELF